MASIGRYVDLQLLGQGGMGAVYRGRDPELDRPVAIKVMLHATADFVARFRREAQAIAKLAHANIVQVYDFGVDGDGNPYFVMELIDGTPLDEIVRGRGKLPPLEAVRLIKQAAAGLAAAHRAGIVHRDVKPSNLIVDATGHVKLVDFGIARLSDGAAPLTNAAALMGTPGYMAPEQAGGKKVDHRADIYALGMTLFELLAGGPAFTSDDPIALVVMNIQNPLPDLRVFAPGTPEELVQLVEMMVQKDPDARLQSCDAAVAALEDVEARLRTGTGVHERRTDAAAIPATNVHASRPVAVDAAVQAGLAPYSIPPAAGASKAPLAIGIGVAVVTLAVGAGVVLFVHGGKPTGDTVKPPLVIQTPRATPPQETPPQETPKPGDTTVESHAKLPAGQKLDGPLRVAVLKFKNVGKDPSLAMLEEGIGETAVNAMASAGGGVTLIERNDIESDIGEIDRGKDDHFDRATIAAKGKLEGVQMAVQGGFQRAGKLVRITARFVRVENGEVVDTLMVTGSARDVFGIQDQVAKGLKQKLLALAALEKVK